MPMKIVTIVGARPQFVKAATVSRAIALHNDSNDRIAVQEVLIHTGQHYDSNMSAVFFEEMQIPRPDYSLDIHDLSHGAMTGRMLEKIEAVLVTEKPQCVLVYGDTNSTLSGALAASKLHIPVIHVEAGLRSYNRHMPEEVNRVLVDHLSTFLYCPTAQAIINLRAEGIVAEETKNTIVVENVGDVMRDAALLFKDYARRPNFNLPKQFVLATLHRAENTDDIKRLTSIFSAFAEVGRQTPVIIPLHPRTKYLIEKNQIDVDPAISLVAPVSYLEMLYLLEKCCLVMTDSGGLQKEAYFFSKPCITLRDETEWVELVEMGVNFLAGAETHRILEAWDLVKKVSSTQFKNGIYGNGTASDKIIMSILNSF